ncbi:MAG: ribosomal-processing cysteine protease Prp [Streptococcaceae bacterium]|jgi:uncharacterized protein YsxB (DUF464 family)|nr:ribosomal-processing cysteine protease Prp [Streptococcaceae bacterium]
MIQAVFRRDADNSIISYEITGHAKSGSEGYDIVCAAVSVLAITTENGIDQLVGKTPISKVDYENGGYLYVKISNDMNQEQLNKAQLLLENFLLGYDTIAKQYPKYVIKAIEVNKNGGA